MKEHRLRASVDCEDEKEFRCPTCSGDHYGSSQRAGVLEYQCHGHESYSRRDPKWPGWSGCGWRGSLQEFICNLHPKSIPNGLREYFAEGRLYHNVCPDCGGSNGGGIVNDTLSLSESDDPYSPCNNPCLHCGKGPMVVRFTEQSEL